MLNLPKRRSIYTKHRPLFILAGIVVEVVLLAALAVLAIVVFGSIYFRVVEHPKFCGSLCHNMNASYESYKKSAHNGIRCAECHSRQGFVNGFLKDTIYAAGREVYIYMEGEEFYDMDEVHPKVYDEGCLRHECHKVETLVEKKNLFVDDNIFSHQPHLSVMSAQGHGGVSTAAEMSAASPELNCTSCHSQSKERHMEVDNQMCFLCHLGGEMASAQECLSCHAIPPSQHETVMNNSCSDCHATGTARTPVSSERCAECHKGIKEQSFASVDAIYSHKLHVKTQTARCMDCHEPMKQEHGKLFAHYDDNCQKCHSVQESMYQGSVKLVAESMPSPKAEMVDCSSCHMSVTEEGIESLDAIRQMCVECHEAGYDEMVDGWQEMIGEEINEAEELLSEVAESLKASQDETKKKEASSLYEDAGARLLFVQKDGSLGAHNVDLADELLTDAIKKLKECQKLLK